MKLTDTITYKLLAAQRKVRQAVEQDFAHVGITLDNYITLYHIYENPGINQIELAILNDKDKNVIVKTLDRLEKEGLAVRKRSDNDRRAFTLSATEQGVALIKKHWNLLFKRQKKSFDVLTKSEQATLLELLSKVIDNEICRNAARDTK